MDKYTDILNPSFMSQEPIAQLMDQYVKQNASPRYHEPTAQYELSNKPRYDITGERYGNTLSDDMFYMKSPGRYKEDYPDRHTPETYEYFANPKGYAGIQTEEPDYVPSMPQAPSVDPGIFPWNRNDKPIGRQKNVTDDGSGVERMQSDWETLDPPGELIAYWDALRNKHQVQDLSTESAMNEKFGDVHSVQDPRYDANWDYYTGSLVNYDRLSRPQLMELAKMGVNRPIVSEDDASADLMGLVNLYRRVLGLK